jgi:GTP-binding protein
VGLFLFTTELTENTETTRENSRARITDAVNPNLFFLIYGQEFMRDESTVMSVCSVVKIPLPLHDQATSVDWATMLIKHVEFAGAIGNMTQKPPGDLLQIAFSGRSNVGKSSLINTVLNRTRSNIARVSATPGKTREINFFTVNAASSQDEELEFFLVDLPGYGYARVPQGVKQQWQDLMEWYLRNTPQLKGVVQLIDVRHEPTEADRTMLRYLIETEMPALIVLTKVDKLTRSARGAQVRTVVRELGVDADQIIEFSAVTGEGKDELLTTLEALLQTGEE